METSPKHFITMSAKFEKTPLKPFQNGLTVPNTNAMILQQLQRIEERIDNFISEVEAKNEFRLIEEKDLSNQLNLTVTQVRNLADSGFFLLEKIPNCRTRFYDREQVKTALEKTEKH